MCSEVSLVLLRPEKRYILENLFNYYVYDMSEFSDLPIHQDGVYYYKSNLLDEYWSEGNHPYLIYYGKSLAGFVLIRRYPSDLSTYDIGQFFVLRPFRRKSIGLQALKKVTSCHPGSWLTRVLMTNKQALMFWQKTIGQLTQGVYEQSNEVYADLMMVFIRYKIERPADRD